MQHWLLLAGAIALEIAGTTSMKLSLGPNLRPGPEPLVEPGQAWVGGANP